MNETEIIVESRVNQGPPGADLSGLGLDDPLPEGFRPAFDVIEELHQQLTGDKEPED